MSPFFSGVYLGFVSGDVVYRYLSQFDHNISWHVIWVKKEGLTHARKWCFWQGGWNFGVVQQAEETTCISTSMFLFVCLFGFGCKSNWLWDILVYFFFSHKFVFSFEHYLPLSKHSEHPLARTLHNNLSIIVVGWKYEVFHKCTKILYCLRFGFWR